MDVFEFPIPPTDNDREREMSFLFLEHDRDFLDFTLRRHSSLKSTPSPSFSDTLDAFSHLQVPGSSRLPSDHSAPPTPLTPSTSIRRRPRDSLPRPKPAPSSTLPPLPSSILANKSKPAPLSISEYSNDRPDSPPLPSSPFASDSLGRSHHRPSHSAPSLLSVSSDSFVPPPSSSSLAPPKLLASTLSFTSTSSPLSWKRASTGSVFTKRSLSIKSSLLRANRSDALACLEGRSKARNRISRTGRGKNFMSLSDDEDENEDEDKGEESDEPSCESGSESECECNCDLEEEEDHHEWEINLEPASTPPPEQWEDEERDTITLGDAILLADEDVVIPRSPLRSSTFAVCAPRPTTCLSPIPIRRTQTRSRAGSLAHAHTAPATPVPRSQTPSSFPASCPRSPSFPSPRSPSLSSSSWSGRSKRRERRGTIDSLTGFFSSVSPLANFIDLADDAVAESSAGLGWRRFVDLAGAS